MPALHDAELLGIWERGLGRSPARRALALLAAVEPAVPPEQLAELTVGQRDAALLDLRERAFGPRMTLVVTCERCGERLEATVEVAALRVQEVAPAQEISIEDCRRRLTVRPPLGHDLVAIETMHEVEAGRRALFERCVVEAFVDGVEVAPDTLPEDAVAAVAAHMAQADPQADLRVELRCPECHDAWEEPLDPCSCLWRELDARAQRLMHDVHELACAYGWSEADVLAVPPQRRHRYVELAAG